MNMKNNEMKMMIDLSLLDDNSNYGRIVEYSKDEIIRVFDLKDKMIIILEGIVKLVLISSDGREKVLLFGEKGDVFGDCIMNESWLSNLFLVTHSECKVLETSFDQLALLTNSLSRSLRYCLLSIAEKKINILLEHLLMISLYMPNKRVAFLLYKLGNCIGEKRNEGIEIPIKLTHQDLAKILGCTRVTVTREMSTLKKQGLINYKNGYIVISDIEDFKKNYF